MKFAGLIILALATPAVADNGAITVASPLDDTALYRAVACGAPPGSDCTAPLLAWPAKQAGNLSVTISVTDPGYPSSAARDVSAALDKAIVEINQVGAAVHVRRGPDGSAADIAIRFFATAEGDIARRSGIPDLDGHPMTGGHVSVDFDAENRITAGMILFAADIGDQNVASIVLEELTQSLGLLYDIDGPAYAETSIFSETGDEVTQLTGQDAALLLSHYPPGT